MKLNYKRTFFIGLAFMSISAFWQMYDNIVPLILQNTFHMDETLIGTIMAMDNVLAVMLLPFFGTLSDKVDTKWGKRTPFIVLGTALAVTLMMVLPYADISNNLILFVIVLGLVLIAMGLYRSPAVALMPDLTPKPLRSKANSIINLMGALGGVYTLILISFLVGKESRPNYYPLFIGVAFLMVAAVVLLLITTNEKKIAAQIVAEYGKDDEEKVETVEEVKEELPKDVKRSLTMILISIFLWFAAYNAVTTAFSRYAQKVWNLQGGGFANCLMVATVAAILSYIPIGIIAEKIGRKKSIMIGLCLMFGSFFSCIFVKEFTPLINIGFVAIGMGWAAIGVNSLPMVVQICKAGDVGKYTGLYYTFSMSAQIITPVLSGWLLGNISYRTLFPYSCVFTALALLTMSQVKHGDVVVPSKKSMLEHFDVED